MSSLLQNCLNGKETWPLLAMFCVQQLSWSRGPTPPRNPAQSSTVHTQINWLPDAPRKPPSVGWRPSWLSTRNVGALPRSFKRWAHREGSRGESTQICLEQQLESRKVPAAFTSKPAIFCYYASSSNWPTFTPSSLRGKQVDTGRRPPAHLKAAVWILACEFWWVVQAPSAISRAQHFQRMTHPQLRRASLPLSTNHWWCCHYSPGQHT